MSLETSEIKSVVGGLRNAIGVDYLYSKNLVFWTDVVEDQIQSANMATGKPIRRVITEGLKNPDGIAVDWIYEHLYWTDTDEERIEVCDLQVTLRKTLFETDLDKPRSIALDPIEGWMFWADWGNPAKIERAGMDGSRRSTIITDKLDWPLDLAVDLVAKKIFWINMVSALCSADYNGNSIRVVYRDSHLMRFPFAVDVFGDFAYWIELFPGSVYKVNKLTGLEVASVATGISSPKDLRVYHPQKQPSGENFCKLSGRCSDLCLPAPRVTPSSAGFSCACPDKTVPTADGLDCLDEFSVPNATRTTTTSSSGTASTTTISSTVNKGMIVQDVDQGSTRDTGTAVGAVVGILGGLATLIALLLFCAYKRYLRQNTARMNVDNRLS